ncbi:isoleucine-tRNA synthetase [Pseudoloma neurophilia]|uniref:Probable isoleucine--tRNA ligase, cytoplasmic n=1 Tax=Pseudoloma neurophilia TaxID=146866 RepID=A0A0R0M027_9MICR|nr:isoleucine-tRNA synthetase [Pseudoloma neurophilia]
MTTEKFSFPKTEEKILQLWNNHKCFEKQNEIIADRPQFVFHDGPPFATGLPHYGHILSGTIKDTVTRYAIQQGYSCSRRFGWDCHGLPVEYEIDKANNITTRKQVIEEIGIANYNQMCKSIVQKYTDQWEQIVKRMARWVDFKNGYRTMDKSFMESIWYTFSKIYDFGRVYRGFRVMAYSTACSTPLSNFEANQNYKEVSDPSVVVKFTLKDSSAISDKFVPYSEKESTFDKKALTKPVSLLIWTTTPWTLPANLGCCVSSEFEYILVLSDKGDEFFILLEERLSAYKQLKNCKVVAKIKGSDLVGLKYTPIFNDYKDAHPELFQVLNNPNVDPTAGTGIIPNSPAFGEEDYNLFLASGLLKESDLVPCPLDDKGIFFETEFKGEYFKDADKLVIQRLKEKNLLICRSDIVHRYPFCWRSDTPLIYKLVPNWFIKLSDFQENLVEVNDRINWIPNNIKSRFSNWLGAARDWSISRNRFWGTPIPIWTDDKFETKLVIRSIEQLETLGYRLKDGKKEKVIVTDLHREFIDDILIDYEGKTLSRIDEVFDCWFESGSMPYAQDHWPFSNKNKHVENQMADLSVKNKSNPLEDKFASVVPPAPADFIAEGLDQTRGWFYTLHVISSLLYDRPSYKNIICFGIVLASDGKKMSKRLKNYPDPMEIAKQLGVDSLRFYLISSPVVEAENLKFKTQGVEEVFKNLLLNWLNCLYFYSETTSHEKTGVQDEKDLSNVTNVFDKWILNEFSLFCQKIQKSMVKYDLSSVLPASLQFIENLSNWYIRMNRDRIRSENDVLFYILKRFSICMAPFTPYFAEYSWMFMNDTLHFLDEFLEETGNTEFDSVHYQLFPKTMPLFECNFSATKKIIEGIRSLREQSAISLKTPLNVCKVISDAPLDYSDAIIKEECNILNLENAKSQDFQFNLKIKPNFNKIKKSHSDENIKSRITEINKIKDKVPDHIPNEEIFVEKTLVFEEKDHVHTTIELKDDGNSQFISLILDLRIDDNLLNLKTARELNAFIQKLRKDCGLSKSDQIELSIADPELENIYKLKYTLIKRSVTNNKMLKTENFEFNGRNVQIGLFESIIQ